MNRGVSGFMKGIGMGIAVGCVAGAMGNSYMKSNKKGLKKNVGRALLIPFVVHGFSSLDPDSIYSQLSL